MLHAYPVIPGLSALVSHIPILTATLGPALQLLVGRLLTSGADASMLPLSAMGCGELLSCLLRLWELDGGLLGEAIEGSVVEFLVSLLARGEWACSNQCLIMLMPLSPWSFSGLVYCCVMN